MIRFIDKTLHGLMRRMTEGSARKHTVAELITQLEASAPQLEARMAAAADTPHNHRQIRHVIGIERWGTQRLRVALGERLKMDEVDDYEPAEGRGIEQLHEDFLAARAETVQVARQLEAASIAPSHTVPHNGMGDLSLRGWLLYLLEHAKRESSRIKAQ
jgi:hypothetical protein